MASFEVVLVRTQAEMLAALNIRRRVFIEGQAIPETLEIDEHDADPAIVTTALHVLGSLDGIAIATGRLLLEPDAGSLPHIGRVAVLEDQRGNGYGRHVMHALHVLARERGFAAVTLAAQLHAIGFYERLGYAARDDVFVEAGIEHRWMDLIL